MNFDICVLNRPVQNNSWRYLWPILYLCLLFSFQILGNFTDFLPFLIPSSIPCDERMASEVIITWELSLLSFVLHVSALWLVEKQTIPSPVWVLENVQLIAFLVALFLIKGSFFQVCTSHYSPQDLIKRNLCRIPELSWGRAPVLPLVSGFLNF